MAAVAELTPVMDGELIELPLRSLVAAGDNPRKELGDLAELATSMKANGLLEPIVATPGEHGRYLIVAGHRRHAAAELAALDTVPVYVRVMDDQQRVAAMLVENLQRSDLTPLEEAGAFKRLVEEFGMGQRALAEQVGRSQGHISKRLALLDLPAKVQADVDSGGITIADAVELAKLKDHPKSIAKALAGSSWQPIALRVSMELDAIKNDELLKAREEALESTAIPTVRMRNEWTLPNGHVPLKASGAWNALQLTATEHKKHGCHTIGLCIQNGKVKEIPLCSDPNGNAHRGAKTADQASGGVRGAVRDPKEEKRERDLEAAAARRRQFTRELLAKKTPLSKADTAQLVVRAMLTAVDDWSLIEDGAQLIDVFPDADLSETNLAKIGEVWHVVDEHSTNDAGCLITASCGFHGLTGLLALPSRKTDPPLAEFCPVCREKLLGDDWDLYERALLAYAHQSEANATRVALGVAFAAIENGGYRGNFRTHGEWGADEANHLRRLQAAGYEVSSIELAQLEKSERSMFPKASA